MTPSLALQIPGVGTVTADNLNTFVQETPLATDLRAFPGLSTMTVVVAGSAAVGDGGAGAFYYDPSSTAADDGATVIVPYGNVQGAWLRSGFLAATFAQLVPQGAWTPFTPTITAGSGTFTSVSASGNYISLGKTTLVSVTISIVTNGSAATSVDFSLPFNSASSSQVLPGFGSTASGLIAPLNGARGAIVKYDGTYPGADGENLVISGPYWTV